VDAFRRTRAPVVVPLHEGRRGHPAFFARESWLDVMTVEAGGARAVVRAYGARVHEEPVADAGVVRDIDTRSDMPRGGWRTSNALS
jgi:molybdenum cofactor cytidylyltransferase